MDLETLRCLPVATSLITSTSQAEHIAGQLATAQSSGEDVWVGMGVVRDTSPSASPLAGITLNGIMQPRSASPRAAAWVLDLTKLDHGTLGTLLGALRCHLWSSEDLFYLRVAGLGPAIADCGQVLAGLLDAGVTTNVDGDYRSLDSAMTMHATSGAAAPAVVKGAGGISHDMSMQAARRGQDELVATALYLDHIRATGMAAVAEAEAQAEPVLWQVYANGLPVDRDSLRKELAQADTTKDVIETRLALATGGGAPASDRGGVVPTWNPNDPSDVRQVLNRFDEDAVVAAFGQKLRPFDSTKSRQLEQVKSFRAKLIREWRSVNQLRLQYTDEWLDRYVGDDNRIRSRHRQGVSATGRVITSDPAVQALNPKVAFHVTAPDGWVLVEADVHAADMVPVVQATKDSTMLALFAAGRDINDAIASRMFEVDIDELRQTDPSLAGEHRDVGKKATLSLAYAQTDYGLAEELTASGIPTEPADAKQVRARHRKVLPGLHTYYESVDDELQRWAASLTSWNWERTWQLFDVHTQLHGARNALIQAGTTDPSVEQLAEHIGVDASYVRWAGAFGEPVVLDEDLQAVEVRSVTVLGRQRRFQIPTSQVLVHLPSVTLADSNTRGAVIATAEEADVTVLDRSGRPLSAGYIARNVGRKQLRAFASDVMRRVPAQDRERLYSAAVREAVMSFRSEWRNAPSQGGVHDAMLLTLAELGRQTAGSNLAPVGMDHDAIWLLVPADAVAQATSVLRASFASGFGRAFPDVAVAVTTTVHQRKAGADPITPTQRWVSTTA